MSIRPYLLPILSLLIASLLSFSVAADLDNRHPVQGMDTIILEDASDVPSAIEKLTTELEQQGHTIPLIVNHSAAAANVDLDLAPNQVIFARPPRFLEKRLLQKSDTAALDLPYKFSIYEDENGNIMLSVNTLGYLIDRHEMKIRDFVLRLTNKQLSQFAKTDRERQGLVTVVSSQSLENTVQALQDAISMNPDVAIPLVLNFQNSNNQWSYGRYRKSSPVLIVFGNPNVGTPLMQTDPRIGIDLPLKFLVWKDHHNRVNITYNDPHFIARRIHLQGQDKRLDAIANALNKLALAGAGGNR